MAFRLGLCMKNARRQATIISDVDASNEDKGEDDANIVDDEDSNGEAASERFRPWAH
jgi:hypothetical protein